MATGWGNKTWGASEWGDLSDETVVVSSVAAQTSVGDFVIQGNAEVEPTTLSATFTIEGAVAGASADVSPTGISLNIITGNEEIGIGVPVTGSSASTSINGVTIDDAFLIGEGWGRDTWGSMVWGDNYSVQLNGISLSTVIGNEDAFTDVTVAVSGQELQSAITPVGTSANSDNEIAHSFLLTGSLGDLTFQGNALVQPTNQTPNFEFTAQGNAALSTDQFKFGTASLELDGTDDYVDTTTNLDLSSTDFTIDVWIRPNSVTGYKGIWESGTSTKEVSYLLGNAVYWTVGGSTIISSSVTVNANEWTMLSYEREGNTHRIYKNGTLEDTASTANKPDNGIFSIGESSFGDFNGYIDEFRVSDIVRYGGSSFTEPTDQFTFDADTQFLLHFDGTDGSTTIKSADDTLFASTISVSSVEAAPKIDVDVTGLSLTTNIGNSDQIGTANVDLTGIALSTVLGDVDAVAKYEPGSASATISAGQVTVVGESVVFPTGIALTISTISPNIIAWAEVDTGTEVTWTDVDLAA